MQVRPRRFRLRFGLRGLLFGLITLAALGGAGTGVFLWLSAGEGESVRVITAVQFPYPQGWSEQPLTAEDRSAGLMLKLDRQDPAATFLARTVIARLAPDFDVSRLADETATALTGEIEGFELLDKGVLALGPYQAVRVEYSQTGVEESPDYHTVMTIVPTENQTFYLTVRATKNDFRKIKEEGLQITNTFVTYVSAGGE
ncbi:MAG: LpqN/LpqT family lipoprotein [Chloroflexota bacterium]